MDKCITKTQKNLVPNIFFTMHLHNVLYHQYMVKVYKM